MTYRSELCKEYWEFSVQINVAYAEGRTNGKHDCPICGMRHWDEDESNLCCLPGLEELRRVKLRSNAMDTSVLPEDRFDRGRLISWLENRCAMAGGIAPYASSVGLGRMIITGLMRHGLGVTGRTLAHIVTNDGLPDGVPAAWHNLLVKQVTPGMPAGSYRVTDWGAFRQSVNRAIGGMKRLAAADRLGWSRNKLDYHLTRRGRKSVDRGAVAHIEKTFAAKLEGLDREEH